MTIICALVSSVKAAMVASLNHPAIVPVYDFGEEDEQPYLVMRYMEGGSLRERLRDAPLSIAEVATVFEPDCPGFGHHPFAQHYSS